VTGTNGSFRACYLRSNVDSVACTSKLGFESNHYCKNTGGLVGISGSNQFLHIVLQRLR